MIKLNLAEIADIVHGTLHGPDASVTEPVVLDSRQAVPGCLFLALAGANVDGLDYVDQAVAKGAVGVLAARPAAHEGVGTIVLDDPVRGVQLLAAYVRTQLSATVVALTGSQGKTSTKDLLAQILSSVGPTIATEGNFNNELGMPLTLLRATTQTEFLVLEMGARGVGHIAALCDIARPEVGAVLNVGTSHIGEFGSQAAIAAAKGELIESLPASGTAVLNVDDPLVAAMAKRTAARVCWVHTEADPVPGTTPVDWWASEVDFDEWDRSSFQLHYAAQVAPVSLQVSGSHQLGNSLLAAALAQAAGASFEEIVAGLSLATATSKWRMEMHHRAGVTVINDSYNANEDSMRAALATLTRVGNGRRPIAVLGQMRELGEHSLTAHARVGAAAQELGVEVLLVVGEASPWLLAGLTESGKPMRTMVTARGQLAADWLSQNVQPGDVVLIKASRGDSLNLVAEELIADLQRREELNA